MDAEGSPDSSTNRGESSDESSGSDSPTLPASPGQGIPKVPGANLYANDGSFLELFKKKMEEQEKMKRETEEGQANKSSANEGQSTAEKKTFNVTNFVRDLAVITLATIDTASGNYNGDQFSQLPDLSLIRDL